MLGSASCGTMDSKDATVMLLMFPTQRSCWVGTCPRTSSDPDGADGGLLVPGCDAGGQGTDSQN